MSDATLAEQVHAHLDELRVPRSVPVAGVPGIGIGAGARVLDLEERITWLGNRVVELESRVEELEGLVRHLRRSSS